MQPARSRAGRRPARRRVPRGHQPLGVASPGQIAGDQQNPPHAQPLPRQLDAPGEIGVGVGLLVAWIPMAANCSGKICMAMPAAAVASRWPSSSSSARRATAWASVPNSTRATAPRAAADEPPASLARSLAFGGRESIRGQQCTSFRRKGTSPQRLREHTESDDAFPLLRSNSTGTARATRTAWRAPSPVCSSRRWARTRIAPRSARACM
jgi:hypothetical protein